MFGIYFWRNQKNYFVKKCFKSFQISKLISQAYEEEQKRQQHMNDQEEKMDQGAKVANEDGKVKFLKYDKYNLDKIIADVHNEDAEMGRKGPG